MTIQTRGKYMKRLLKMITVLSAALMIMLGGACVSAESEYKLYDNAMLLTEEENAEIEARLQEIADNYGHDIIVVTADSLDGSDVESYTERCYSSLGAGINGSGIIYLVAMNERKYDIYARGEMRNTVMTENLRDEMAEELQPYLTSGDYYTAFMEYADKCEYEMAYVLENGYNSANKPMAIPIAAVIGLIIALVTVLVMKSGMKTTRPEPKADNYIKNGSFKLNTSRDIFLYSSYSRVKHSSSKSDSGHSSGSF